MTKRRIRNALIRVNEEVANDELYGANDGYMGRYMEMVSRYLIKIRIIKAICNK